MKALALLLLLAPRGEVVEVRDQAYVDGPDAHARKHTLDLYLPKGKPGFPTVVFFHGGAWRQGDKALYGGLGRRFAEDGIALAAANYRLSPEVKHPEHVRDCARAFAWVRSNIARHGGDPERLFVMGHSAGGHLAALLALHPKHLEDVKVPREAIKGAIPMSGVYVVPALPADTKGFLKILPEAFGSEAEVCRDASPATHVANTLCPFLVLTETNDTLRVRPSMELFRAAVDKSAVKDFTFLDAEDRDHASIIVRMTALGDDPYRRRIVDFIRARCK